MAVNKCNITKYALELYNSMKWEIKCDSNVNRDILENYINYLACEDVDLIVCSPDDCSNPTIISSCVCEIVEITENKVFTEDVTVIYSLQIGDYTNCSTPFTYLWDYNEEFFDLVGGVTSSTLQLKIKDEIRDGFDGLEYAIGVSITDANGCTANKVCYHVSDEAQTCEEDYIECVNPRLLEVLPPTL